MTMLLIVTTE
jgi:hypothetical protein